jgi:hypothetical protein
VLDLDPSMRDDARVPTFEPVGVDAVIVGIKSVRRR